MNRSDPYYSQISKKAIEAARARREAEEREIKREEAALRRAEYRATGGDL